MLLAIFEYLQNVSVFYWTARFAGIDEYDPNLFQPYLESLFITKGWID